MVSRLTVLAPATPEETVEMVRSYDRLFVPQFELEDRIVPHVPYAEAYRRAPWSRLDVGKAYAGIDSDDIPDVTGPLLLLHRQSGVLDFSPADQVATFRTGTPLGAVQAVLREEGQCLPFADDPDLKAQQEFMVETFPRDADADPIYRLIGRNAPHVLDAPCGNWRDWILGMKVVLADGTLAKCGSHAVKNVAGYDVQKLFVGARGSLGIVVEVTLRTYPARSLPKPEVQHLGEYGRPPAYHHRVPLAEIRDYFERLESREDPSVVALDYRSGTVWGEPDYEDVWQRFPGDWVEDLADPGRFLSEEQRGRMRRAKAIFDPTNKLNPGEWGFI